MTDVAVSVHCNPSDVKNGTDDTQSHKETTDLKKKTERKLFVSDCVDLGLLWLSVNLKKQRKTNKPPKKLVNDVVLPCIVCFPVPSRHETGHREPRGRDRRLPQGQQMPNSPQTHYLERKTKRPSTEYIYSSQI